MSRPLTEGIGVPLAVPAASASGGGVQARTHAEPGQRRMTTTTRFVAPSSRVGRRALSAVGDSLSARDWAILRTVAAHRYLTTRQMEGFCFADHATPLTAARVCRRVLRRLDHLLVLSHLERRIGGVRAGSASYVWQVGRVGHRLLAATNQQPSKRAQQHEPGWLFLDHCLAVADAHLALLRLHRAAELELITVQTEPDCWRRYSGVGGARLVLQPDLYVVTGAGEFEDHWFIEIDRDTEHPKRLLAKCQRYEDYRRSGIEQATGGSFPLVVWVMRGSAQAERLRQTIASDGNLDRCLFRVTTADAFGSLIREGAE